MFPDEESYLIAAKQFYDAKEYNKVIEITNNLDLSESDNELLKIRMEAMEKTGSKHYKSEVFKWFIRFHRLSCVLKFKSFMICQVVFSEITI